MKLSIEYKNSEQNTLVKEANLSYLAFMKHLAFQGLAGEFDDYKVRRFLRCFVEYQTLFSASNDGFKLPTSIQYDVHEKNYMHYHIGKVVADFVAKRIANATFSINYDAAVSWLNDDAVLSKPDLYCFNHHLKKQFSLKTKALTKKTVYPNEVEKYKVQQSTAETLSNESAVSVVYNIYDNIQVKFYESPFKVLGYNEDCNTQLIDNYYNNIRFLFESFRTQDLTFFDLPEEIKNNFVAYKAVDLYKYELVNAHDFQRTRHFWKLYSDILELYILVHKNIIQYANVLAFNQYYDTKNYYVDSDGIGICFLTK